MNTFPGIPASFPPSGPNPAGGGSSQSHRAVRTPRVITTRPQLGISDRELHARVQWAHRVSPHFSLSFDRMAFADAQASGLLDLLEEGYGRMFHLTHESFADRLPVYLVDQRATALLGRAVKPHLNREEHAMYLVESSAHHASADVLRLLTHAMRFSRYEQHYGRTPGWSFLEEALSVFLSARLSMQPDVFPFYGAEADVIAHHLHTKSAAGMHLALSQDPEAAITLDEMVLNGAFFLYLGDTHGDDLVVTFSKSEDEITGDSFRAFFGSSLLELEEEWTTHLPVSLLALTHDEQERMIEQWQRAIEPLRVRI